MLPEDRKIRYRFDFSTAPKIPVNPLYPQSFKVQSNPNIVKRENCDSSRILHAEKSWWVEGVDGDRIQWDLFKEIVIGKTKVFLDGGVSSSVDEIDKQHQWAEAWVVMS